MSNLQAVEPGYDNDIATLPHPETSTSALVLDGDSLDRMMKLAEIMATGVATLPRHFHGNPSDCLAVVMQSMQWRMNPYAVAQKTHLVNGVLGYEAQLVNAVITTAAPVKDRLNYEWFGDWSKVIGKFEIRRGDKGEYRIPGWKLADEQGLGVRVWATFRGESKPRELELLLAQARTRNSTLWADDPRQQLAYLATKRWSRLYCPDVILGVYTPDELEESRELKDVTPREQALPPYPDDEFKKKLPTWRDMITSGKQTAERIIAKIETKGFLTDEQKRLIRGENHAEPDADESASSSEGEE